MKYKLIASQRFYREICHAAAHAPSPVWPVFLPEGDRDRARRLLFDWCAGEGQADAILLPEGYADGLCEGLTAPVPLVLPRVHNGYHLLLGGRYRALVAAFGGEAAFYTQGQLEWAPPRLAARQNIYLSSAPLLPGLPPRGEGWQEYAVQFDWLEQLCAGIWPQERFLVLQPGQAVQPSYRRDVLAAR